MAESQWSNRKMLARSCSSREFPDATPESRSNRILPSIRTMSCAFLCGGAHRMGSFSKCIVSDPAGGERKVGSGILQRHRGSCEHILQEAKGSGAGSDGGNPKRLRSGLCEVGSRGDGRTAIILEFSQYRFSLRPGKTDLHKGINGMSVLIQNAMQHDPLSKRLLLFWNGQQILLKTIYWDRNGFWLWQKVLEMTPNSPLSVTFTASAEARHRGSLRFVSPSFALHSSTRVRRTTTGPTALRIVRSGAWPFLTTA